MTPRECTVGGLRTFVVRAYDPRAVLLIRTPYNSEAHLAEASHWAARGLTTVVQDVRGRYGSVGTFRPYDGEGVDGVTTVDWVAAQSWWSEAPALFLYGTSYGAWCAVEAARAARGFVGIAGVSVVVPALGMGETARNRDGAFCLESRLGWWSEHGGARRSRERAAALDVLESLPVSRVGARANPGISAWSSVLSARRSDRVRANTVATLPHPLLAQGGTWDWFTQDTVDLWSSWGGPSALALGPWDHTMRGSGRAERMSAWLDAVLDGRPWTGARLHGHPGGPVCLERWPTAFEVIRLPGGSFAADPLQPFPSVALGTDVRCVSNRTDCLTWKVPWHTGFVVGTPMVRVDSADRGRHWSAMLVVHRRDGRAEHISYGTSLDSVVHLEPLSTYIHEEEELALIISAHSFPRHARDLQTGEDHLQGSTAMCMRRTVRGVVFEMPT